MIDVTNIEYYRNITKSKKKIGCLQLRFINKIRYLSQNLNIIIMNKLQKNLVLEGPFSVETPDTSGEVLKIEGADISELQTGKSHLNTEHISPTDADKNEVHKDHDGYRGFQSIIGRVVNAKKIFSDKDCATDRELKAWNEFRKPMIYGQVEIYDGENAHENAKAAAALVRMFNNISNGPRFGLSVEGSTIEREGNLLKRTVIRSMAGTLKPANRAATVDIVADSSAPQVTKSMSAKTYEGGHEPLRKSVSMQYISVVPTVDIPNDFGLSQALVSLRKALTAGMTNSSPGSLTGGAALQKESQLAKLVKLVGPKLPSRDSIKKAIPGISDEDAKRIEAYFKKKSLKKNTEVAESVFEEMIGKYYKK